MWLLRWVILLGLAYAGWCALVMFGLNLSSGAQVGQPLHFTVAKGSSYDALEKNLVTQWPRKKFTGLPLKVYVKLTGIDRKLVPGDYTVLPPQTAKRFVESLERGPDQGETFTIIPGWDLRDIANALVKSGRVSSTQEVYTLLGKPAAWGKPVYQPNNLVVFADGKPANVSWEGYLAPETIAFANDATIADIARKFSEHQMDLFTPQMLADIKTKKRTVHEILTMASLLEREVRSAKDKAIVSDIFWKRHDVNMGLQADSSVHYATAKEGSVFTTNADRDSNNPWNTYKYPALPPGPIAVPSLASIKAAIYPEANDYWYFLTTLDTGEVKYGKTLAEHNANVYKYLR